MSYKPDFKHMRKRAPEEAAERIVKYVRAKGFSETPRIVSRTFSQRGTIALYFKAHPDTDESCVVELGYDWPSRMLREYVEDTVRILAREKLKEPPNN